MKKKLLSLVFTLLVMIPCACLITACDSEDPNKIKVTVTDNNDPGITGLIIYDATTYAENIRHEIFKWEKGDVKSSKIDKGQTGLILVQLQSGYSIGNLKLRINDELKSFELLEHALSSVCNPSWVEFTGQKDKVGIIWKITEKTVGPINLSFEGSTAKNQFTLSVAGLDDNKNGRQKIVNYQNLRFAININNKPVLPENATFEQLQSYFTENDNVINNLNYGDKVVFRVWFENKVVPFNNTRFLRPKTWYLLDAYYDVKNKESVYEIEIRNNESIEIYFADIRYADINYNEIYLDFKFVENYYRSNEELNIETILDTEKGAIYNISFFKEIDYELLMKNYTNIKLGNTQITQEQKQKIFSYDSQKLKLNCDFGNVPSIYYYLDESNPSRMMLNSNNYCLEIYFDYENMAQDQTWGKRSLRINSLFNGQKFEHNFEVSVNRFIQSIINYPVDSRLGDDIFIFKEANMCIFEGGEYKFKLTPKFIYYNDTTFDPTVDNTLFKNITITYGEQSFDVTWGLTDEINGVHGYIGNSTINGITVESFNDGIIFTCDSELIYGELEINYSLM